MFIIEAMILYGAKDRLHNQAVVLKEYIMEEM